MRGRRDRSKALVVVLWLFIAVLIAFAVLENLGSSQKKSYIEIAEGLVIAAVLPLLFQWAPKLLRAMPAVARALARPVTISKNVRKTALIFFIAGVIVFSFQVFLDWAWGIPFLHGFSYYMVYTYFQFHALQSSGSSVGSVAFLAAAAATAGLTIYRLDKGTGSAFRQALETFTLPAILVLIFGVAVFGQSYLMPDHVTYFATWSLGGVYLVSNYFVLIVSASLETMLLLW